MLLRRLALPALALAVASGVFVAPGHAQRGRVAAPLGPGPWVYDTFEPKTRIKVSVLTRGLVRPWSLTWLPTGEMLVTERPGRLRIVRNGVLDPTPISGVPAVVSSGLSGLMDVLLHPRFAENRLVYLTYSRKADYGVTTALARGRLDGHSLVDIEETDEDEGAVLKIEPSQ